MSHILQLGILCVQSVDVEGMLRDVDNEYIQSYSQMEIRKKVA